MLYCPSWPVCLKDQLLQDLIRPCQNLIKIERHRAKSVRNVLLNNFFFRFICFKKSVDSVDTLVRQWEHWKGN